MRRGFTLVELSIVLVIIGLLIGGILIGQSLIASAALTGFVSQIQQYDVAVSGFRSKLKCLPGDCSRISPAGDGDGKIEQMPAGQDDRFEYEISCFWNHLSALGFLKANPVYRSDAAGGVRRGVHVPKIGIGDESGIVAFSPHEYGATDENDYPDIGGRPVYQIYSTSQTVDDSLSPAYADGVRDSLAIPEMLGVESKMDDGNAMTGNVRAAGSGEYTMGQVNAAAGSGCVKPEDKSRYQIDSTESHPCSMLIVMLSQVGQ